jgi:hypothetical protein
VRMPSGVESFGGAVAMASRRTALLVDARCEDRDLPQKTCHHMATAVTPAIGLCRDEKTISRRAGVGCPSRDVPNQRRPPAIFIVPAVSQLSPFSRRTASLYRHTFQKGARTPSFFLPCQRRLPSPLPKRPARLPAPAVDAHTLSASLGVIVSASRPARPL